MDIRAISPDEFRDYARVWEYAFSFDGKDEEYEAEKKLFEFDRTFAATEDDEFIGTAAAFSFDLRVPGGSIPVGGLTGVAVRPTHRRRGVLTALMGRHIEDVMEHGEPATVLRASESLIYGR